MIQYRWAFVLFVLCLLASVAATAQQEDSASNNPHYWWDFSDWHLAVDPPYAGKFEARIGGSRESANDKLRLDIGASTDIAVFDRGYADPLSGMVLSAYRVFTIGADFFTWTRLRANDNFKFPVEAVDYYFGINATYSFANPNLGDYGPDVRLRLAHISAHLVDGDPSFTNPQQQYITYSREFADVMVGIDVLGFRHEQWQFGEERELRPYVGAVWLFHTIPDTLGVVTPYAGLDFNWQPDTDIPLTIRGGYEARLNTELEPIGEHQVKIGLKLGNVGSRGVVIEGGYYAGRSQYGQHFSQREEYFSIGFAVDY